MTQGSAVDLTSLVIRSYPPPLLPFCLSAVCMEMFLQMVPPPTYPQALSSVLNYESGSFLTPVSSQAQHSSFRPLWTSWPPLFFSAQRRGYRTKGFPPFFVGTAHHILPRALSDRTPSSYPPDCRFAFSKEPPYSGFPNSNGRTEADPPPTLFAGCPDVSRAAPFRLESGLLPHHQPVSPPASLVCATSIFFCLPLFTWME